MYKLKINEKFFDQLNNILLQVGDIFSDITKELNYWIELVKKEEQNKKGDN